MQDRESRQQLAAAILAQARLSENEANRLVADLTARQATPEEISAAVRLAEIAAATRARIEREFGELVARPGGSPGSRG